MELRSQLDLTIAIETAEAGHNIAVAPTHPPLMQWADERRSNMLVWLARYGQLGGAVIGFIVAAKLGLAALLIYLAPIQAFDREAFQTKCENLYDGVHWVYVLKEDNKLLCHDATALRKLDKEELEHDAAVKIHNDEITSGKNTAVLLYFLSVILLPVSIARAILTATFALPAAALVVAALWCAVEATAISTYAIGALILIALSFVANMWDGFAPLYSLLGLDDGSHGPQTTVANSRYATPRHVQHFDILKRQKGS